MKAAVYYGPKKMVLEEVPKPVAGRDEAVVKVEVAAVCGTDIKTYRRGHPLFEPPCILGHEFAGKVVELGSEVKTISLGDRVVVAPYVPCGKCYFCEVGRLQQCTDKRTLSGAFAEYVKVPGEVIEKGLVVVPEHVPSSQAALTEPLACCINAIEECEVGLGDTVLIIGGGPMGLLLLELCKIRGASLIILSEPVEERRKIAEELGAIVINPLEEDLNLKIKQLTSEVGVDAVFLCLGIPEIIGEVLCLARNGGVVNIFGGLPKNSKVYIDPNIIHYGEVKLLGSFGFAPVHFKKALKLIACGKIDIEKLISCEAPFEEINDIFNTYGDPKKIKVLIKP